MNLPNNVKFCPECQVGIFKQHLATYYTWIEDELVTVPDFPCWVCDVCGHRDWDTASLMQLNMLLSPDAGTPIVRSRRRGTADFEPPAAPKRTRRRSM